MTFQARSGVALSARQLVKRYPNGVLACDGASLEVSAGEIHALVGENGAGKSTLMKMLYGLETPDAGEVLVDGREQRFRSPADAIAAGIGLVPQHVQLVPSMTVAENIVLGAEPVRGPWRVFDRRRAGELTRELMEVHGLSVDDRAVAELSVGQQQRVEILKALYRGARLLLLDEPTALLSPQEADTLFNSLRRLVAQGMTVVLITHKMSEVRDVSRRFTVMRGGRIVGSGLSSDHRGADLAELIVGRRVESDLEKRIDARGREALVKVRGLSLLRPAGRPELQDVSLDIAAGEILGIAGVEGNGQDCLADVLSGLKAPSRGQLTIAGEQLAGRGVRHARSLGVGCVPEDRLNNGMAPGLSLAENAAAIDYHRPPMSRLGVLNVAEIRERARDLLRRYEVHGRDEDVLMGSLSGGNMQKLVMGREIQAAPRLLVASQPTRGVDVGAAQGLRGALRRLRDAGAAVMLVSADLDELVALSDRIAVLYEGRLVAHLEGGRTSPRRLGLYMTGLASDPDAQATLDAPFSSPLEEVAS
jgi:simple sugar transport system ATP-binding protein